MKYVLLVFEIDKKIYYGLERKYTAKSVEFNIQTDRGNLSLRGYLGPIIWEGFFPEISNNENSKGYLFHPTIQTVDGEANYDYAIIITEILEIDRVVLPKKSVCWTALFQQKKLLALLVIFSVILMAISVITTFLYKNIIDQIEIGIPTFTPQLKSFFIVSVLTM